MPRQRNRYNRRTYVFPDNFPERLKRFRKSRACRGRRSPAAWRPIATPYGVGLKAESGPTNSTGRR